MRRRDFISLVGGSAVAWPLAARAQQPLPVIGFLSSRLPDDNRLLLPAFRKGELSAGILNGVRGFDAMGRQLAALDQDCPHIGGGHAYSRFLGYVHLGAVAVSLHAAFAAVSGPTARRAPRSHAR